MLGQERSSDMKVVRSDVQTPDVPTNEPGYWQDRDIRLRPVRPKDAERWLLEENTDSEADHFLNYGITLPKSQGDAEAFADRYANFNNADERIMFSTETLDGELAGGINLRSMNRTAPSRRVRASTAPTGARGTASRPSLSCCATRFTNFAFRSTRFAASRPTRRWSVMPSIWAVSRRGGCAARFTPRVSSLTNWFSA